MIISIIIPTYKPAAYLWECLDSIVRQKHGGYQYEVLLVLNGEKEPFFSDINKYLENHPSLNAKLLYSEQPGVSRARNMALDNASGDYFTFLDDDDYVSDTYLYNMSRFASPDTMVMAKAHAFCDNTKEFIPYRLTDEFNRVAKEGVFPAFHVRSIYCGVCMKLIHKSIIGNNRFEESLKNSEDALFMFETSKRFHKMTCAPSDTIYYRRVRDNRASDISNNKKWQHAIKMTKKYILTYIKSPLEFNFLFLVTRVLGAIKGAIAKDNY